MSYKVVEKPASKKGCVGNVGQTDSPGRPVAPGGPLVNFKVDIKNLPKEEFMKLQRAMVDGLEATSENHIEAGTFLRGIKGLIARFTPGFYERTEVVVECIESLIQEWFNCDSCYECFLQTLRDDLEWLEVEAINGGCPIEEGRVPIDSCPPFCNFPCDDGEAESGLSDFFGKSRHFDIKA